MSGQDRLVHAVGTYVGGENQPKGDSNMLDLDGNKFKSVADNVSTLKELTALIRRNKVIPFIGAGMSIKIYGSWGSALKRFMEGHVFGQDLNNVKNLIVNGRFAEAAEKISDVSGVIGFQDRLIEVFGESATCADGALKLTHDILKEMPVRYLPKVFKDSLVVTTNFDKVLERVYSMDDDDFENIIPLRHITRWQAMQAQRNSPHYLIKIHGCVSAPDEVVMTKKSYDDFYNQEKYIKYLRSIFEGNTLLFIGCGLNQDRTVNLLREVGLGDHYAILEMNGEVDEQSFKDRKKFMSDDLQMHCIWYPQNEHHYVEDILEHIHTDISTHLKVDIATPVKTSKPAVKLLNNNESYYIGRWKGEPLEWIVLDAQPDKALLITKDCLSRRAYNKKQTPTSWYKCSLRREWLNEILDQVFDETERDRVLLCNNKNPANPTYGTLGGVYTNDKLFLLSIDEVKQYFPYDIARISRVNRTESWWWLRSMGYDTNYAAYVRSDGHIFDRGFQVDLPDGGVRPAFWLKL